MADVTYVLPEWKLIWLLHRTLVEGFVYGVLSDQPMGPNDYDPFEKPDGEKRWVIETSKRTRRQLRRFKKKSSRT